MEHGKAALAVVLIILGLVGFGLTWDLYSVLNVWNNMTPYSILQQVGYGLYWVLPMLTAIFSVMFELLGLYLLYKSTKQPKTD